VGDERGSPGVVEARRQGRRRCYRLEDRSALAVYEQVADRLREQIAQARSQLTPQTVTTLDPPPTNG
jgi:hypothetical protein